MDRRYFVQMLLASTVAMPRKIWSQTIPLPPVLDGQSSTNTIIQLAARRYDGNSGEAVFNGGIPLQPGQLRAGNLGNISLWRNEAEIPLNVRSLAGRHPDGSLKAIQVQTKLLLGSGSLPLVLDLATPSSKGATNFETITYRWVQKPRLLVCTDAVHMCASRIAPLPLVPLSHRNLPTDWQVFLTSGADSFASEIISNGTASYNWVYGWLCRYLCTADSAPLVHAMKAMATNEPNNYSGVPFSYYVADDGVHTVDGQPADFFNPDDFPGVSAGNRGFPPEWYDSSLDCYLMYYLTGWELPRRTLVHIGAGAKHRYETHNPYDGIYNNPRFSYRAEAMPCMLDLLMENDFTVHHSNGLTQNIMTTDTSVKLQQCIDNASDWPATDFRHGILGSCRMVDNGNQGGEVGKVPLFQYEVMLPFLIGHYLNIDADPRIPPAMSKLGEYIRSNWKGPFQQSDGLYFRQQSYWEVDPSAVTEDDSGESLAYPYMLFPALAYTYAFTGKAEFRDVIDQMVSIPNPKMGGEWRTQKLAGQIFAMAYHAAAYRAGVSPTGWR